MLFWGVFLVVLSPYTAWLPILFTAVPIYKMRTMLWEESPLLKAPWNIVLMLIAIWSLVVGVINGDKLSVTAALALFGYLSLSIYLQLFYNSEERVEKLIRIAVDVSQISMAVGFIEKMASLYIDMSWVTQLFWSPTYIPNPEIHRIYSTFGNPNVAGAWFAVMALVSFYFYEKEHGREKTLWLLKTVLFIIFMALTGSKGAILGLISGGMVYAIFTNGRRAQFTLLLMAILMGGLALWMPEINHPTNSREAIWTLCREMFLLKPLSGWGLLGIYKYSGEIHGHNNIMTIAATLGSTGLGLYFFLKYHLLRGVLKLVRNGSDLAKLLAAVQALIVGQGFVDFIILSPQGGLLFFVSSSLIFALANTFQRVPISIANPVMEMH